MKLSPLNMIDWYKADHRRQYPDGTSLIFTNFTPRKSRLSQINYVIFFGLQYFIKEYLIRIWTEEFFKMDIEVIVKKFNRRVTTSLGPNDIGEAHIRALHKLGYLPLKIMALPEGSKVGIRIPPMIMWNTKPDFFWLPNHLETILSCTLWQPSLSATLAYHYKQGFDHWAMKTVGNTDFTSWQGHDFSFRGMSSLETAMLSGAGHLLSFTGTDTVPAIDFLEEYYNADAEKEIIGGSIPATEHSVMCMGGKEGELETFRRLFKLYPQGPLAIVSDTWDYWNIISNAAKELKVEILARQNGKIVFRPDSSKKTPYEIIVGDPEGEDENEVKGSIQILWEIFGGTESKEGYKVLDSHVGLIYGDSITFELADKINAGLARKGFASTNWVAGIGSFTYQYNTRDTFGWAMKATYGEICPGGFIDGELLHPDSIECREIFKDPKTDSGMKKSAKGLIAVYKNTQGQFVMKDQVTWKDVLDCEYKTVFEDGKLLIDDTLSAIRERVKNA
jgi:nicotinamide phosphoribosyltransferase